ncbi:MAG: PorV/PorQ family protein [Bacteroidetes bacterium]|nr:PorV/PorQ family protein [Bacteroidota bacterium]
MRRILTVLALVLLVSGNLFAGNPDRRGEAGAYELVMNGWGRSSGFFSMNSANVAGIESERINPAGLAFTQKTEMAAAYTLWLQGSGVGLIHGGIAQNIKNAHYIGISVQALSLGIIERTTAQNPEGGIGTFRPAFVNIGISYAHRFSNSISGGVTFRLVNEGLGNINAFGLSVDAGLQYVTGKKDNIHFGVSLRNVGTAMTFRGDALATSVTIVSSSTYQLTASKRANKFELPTQLNIGAAYDIWMGKKREVKAKVFKQDYRLTILANFTSNAFGYDYYGVGAEFGWKEILMLRAAYRFENGMFKESTSLSAYTGLAAGLTVQAPFKKDGGGPILSIDYSFRATRTFMGTHSIGLRFNL